MAPHGSEGGDQWVKVTPRRRFIRYRTDLPISVRDQLEHDFDGRCEFISENGMSGTVVSPLPLGSVVHLRFTIPTYPTQLDLAAIVRDLHEFQHGFEFVSLTEPEKVAIRQFCREMMIQSETGFVDP